MSGGVDGVGGKNGGTRIKNLKTVFGVSANKNAFSRKLASTINIKRGVSTFVNRSFI